MGIFYKINQLLFEMLLPLTSGHLESVSRSVIVRLFVTPRTAAHQASLSFTISQSLLKFMSIKLVMPHHLILCCPLLLPPLIFPSASVLASGGPSIGASASTSVFPMNIQGWFPFRIDWFDLLAVQGTLKSLLQYHSSEASRCHNTNNKNWPTFLMWE